MSTIFSARRTAALKAPAPPVQPRRPYGDAQAQFIRKYRKEIESNIDYFADKDWRRISSGVGIGTNLHSCAVSPESLYVKDVAVWIPHRIIPGFRPSCTKCKSNVYVDIPGSKMDWVSRPKILYGINTHRYLDTVYYGCKNCGGKMAGYNEDSMKLDAQHMIGIFNFRLGNGYAIDDELYSFIVSHSNETTASIYRRLSLLRLVSIAAPHCHGSPHAHVLFPSLWLLDPHSHVGSCEIHWNGSNGAIKDPR